MKRGSGLVLTSRRGLDVAVAEKDRTAVDGKLRATLAAQDFKKGEANDVIADRTEKKTIRIRRELTCRLIAGTRK